ncbi:hypothetical protein CYLTODRAFT_357386 [Cylindrobasidium torrendii FP15055 ss-10]|uniref:ATP-dependent DNA helicase n=1 Tax=Cylindrobasidium torrendii FP15055 ss-10 TaxID=1314674 RepID=A0A0D7B3M0_9AGAR|nr:hypothetical protein CYLTODRAFT_357386 [Cylindrobasidium torrendii FP15055 ss-10]
MIIGGPGGTGKSHIYQAVREFHEAIGKGNELAFTAPTGVAASNIGGNTVHSELSLNIGDKHMTPTSIALSNLRERLESTKTLIIDEVYFLGCSAFEKVRRYNWGIHI